MTRKEFISRIISTGALIALVPTVLLSESSEVGKNFSTFTLTFDQKFDNRDTIIGPNGIPLIFIGEPELNKNGDYVHQCRIITNDPDAYLIFEDIDEPIKINATQYDKN